MKRILFVDDEHHILDGLRHRLRRRRKEWEMVFAPGGPEGLAALESGEFDCIVADMRMPKVDGAQLLRRVQRHHPATVRIVLSGYLDDDVALRAILVAHRFLKKPCDTSALQETIERTCDLQAVLNAPNLRQLVGGLDVLPSRPRVYDALTDVLNDPNVSLDAVGQVLEQDLAISAKVLQLINSAFFGLNRSVSRVTEALRFLGVNAVRGLALTAALGRALSTHRVPGFSLELLERRALIGAQIATRIMGRKGPDAEAAFTGAILRDIGQLVLASRMPGHYARTLQCARDQARPLQSVESEVSGLSHPQVGAYLLGLWGLPFAIVEAVAKHHEDDVSWRGLDVTAAVRLAEQLVCEQLGTLSGNAPEPIDPAYVAALGVQAALEGWRDSARLLCGESQGAGQTVARREQPRPGPRAA